MFPGDLGAGACWVVLRALPSKTLLLLPKRSKSLVRRSKAQLDGMKKLIASAEEKMQDLMSAAKVPGGSGFEGLRAKVSQTLAKSKALTYSPKNNPKRREHHPQRGVPVQGKLIVRTTDGTRLLDSETCV